MLEQLYQAQQTGGYAAAATLRPNSAAAHVYLALLAFAERDFASAHEHARQAASRDREHALYGSAASYLERVRDSGPAAVYTSPEAFAAFIRGGGNVGLYRATSAALGAIYDEYASLRLLDIGAGDGHALLPALRPSVAQLSVLEPSAAMLQTLRAQLEERSIAHACHQQTLQAFAASQPADARWDVAQASYSLQSVTPEDRPAMLSWLRERCDRLLLVEFDMPLGGIEITPERVRYVLERYDRGLREYRGDLVAQGFLMPVFFGYFDPTQRRTNWELSAAAWTSLLRAAGFGSVSQQSLFDYWWAPAVLLDAR
ncbi:methyltransferase domain-containing protein [Haliangium ochraceum]|uniref:Uncharacterized protein n=1 Tax=Haliangium ochraceum (strain DSM 14365 / JCM 11303 / SMP-2) TaxID=502025 RepID=D0LMJ6_HALO1|nr:class I SAM-dependent methyltransferase [Haliangium ochraceum]ACY18683.1 conserved hypothetical protein [Haliangium ochraceum DSM 14365]